MGVAAQKLILEFASGMKWPGLRIQWGVPNKPTTRPTARMYAPVEVLAKCWMELELFVANMFAQRGETSHIVLQLGVPARGGV